MTPLLLQSRLDTLDAWEREGLTFRLDPDTHGFQWKARTLADWQQEHLREHKGQFAEALRFRAGVCIRCGDDAAKHPAKNPKFPALWCKSCFARGAWESWSWGVPLKGGPKANADSAKQRDDALFAGIGDDDDDGEPTAAEGLGLFDGPADGVGAGGGGGAHSFLSVLWQRGGY